MTSLLHPPVFRVADRQANRVLLASDAGATLEIFVLEDDIVRVRILPDATARNPRTWTIAPGLDDVPLDGRDRLDLSGFALPAYAFAEDDLDVRIETAQVRLAVRRQGGHCTWSMRGADGAWRVVLADRATQAYNFGWWDDRAYHYVARERGDKVFGLGERAGELDRTGARFEMRNIDAMGYSAKHTDPLYKHIPFTITWSPDACQGFGLFYDTLSDCTFDMGRELDNYHGLYRYFVAEHGDLDYYFIASPDTPLTAARRFTWLTGRPARTPKWGLGYSGSTMSYTDAPDAQRQMNQFVEQCDAHDILCDSFHLSSGYTSIGAKRYVFNWNREKFPDAKGFVKHYRDHGIRLCANIKPCLLRDHPAFDDAARRGLLIRSASGEPAWVQFWDEVGAYIDFTQPDAYRWWREQVTSALLDYGIESTWNDNNEYEIWSPDAIAHGFGQPFPAREAKVLQTMLMMRASRDAQRAHAPARRPFLVSRSGGAGMQRYVQTWSGDNYTSWETLRYNLKMGLGLALSGVSNIGHDIGGFSGLAPSPELLLRWVQFGIFMPRFSIHSWNDDGTVNEPWMYPEITAQIASLIKQRYRLLPYLYHLLWLSTTRYEPVLRPTFGDFPGDPRCYDECDDMMLGDALLVAPVVDPGRTERTVYLPSGARWTCCASAQSFDGGASVTLPAPLDTPVMLLREGRVLPLNVAAQRFGARADTRGFIVAPRIEDGVAYGECVEDDGETEAWRDGEYGLWRIETGREASGELGVSVRWEGRMHRPAERVEILLPASLQGALAVRGARVEHDARDGAWRRIVVALVG
ncbi:glycoside hydrolase family 31 protein [Burkholderia ambifaria]|uniref:glycoside hydrolase family 31 protein n=1 Tax=Burkholderia ambifaria TaxID=152480 RepID=UPI001E3D25CB|nr:glycoside hydrolase family 31 protein [Burkholderia ambifaria]UEP24859.1 glycoside hydrolase family 31 protein [Burkholderia ambifaria]